MNNHADTPDALTARRFLRDIVAWHGYVRFLGLPSYQNSPDVAIDELYVPHSLSSTYLSPDSDPGEWSTFDPAQLLAERRRLVVLGDPGSGKSTLINWFAWSLATGQTRRFPPSIAQLVPIPLILRELPLSPGLGFYGLLDAFLTRPVAQAFAQNPKAIYQLLHSGRLLLLVDGLDEVSADLRISLKQTLFAAFEEQSLFAICTSRIVGYDEWTNQPQILADPTNDGVFAKRQSLGHSQLDPHYGVDSKPSLVYVAPFRNDQIARFALNWYRDQGGPEAHAQLLRDEFFAAISSDESTLRLARTPNLLTMMAQIYRVRARLPNGRALLYEDIAQAYLESIDTARKLKDEYSWRSKKRWLSRVGFEMQLRREQESETVFITRGELLIARSDILKWVTEAIKHYGDQVPVDYPAQYLEWITRRSGLLLPRGEGLFSFLHLSFQEYFCALYIKQQMEAPDWLSFSGEGSDHDLRVSPDSILRWSHDGSWHQTLVFLFELFSEQPGWPRKLLSICFPQDLSASRHPASTSAHRKVKSPLLTQDDSHALSRAQLCIQVLSDPHGGISVDQRTVYMGRLRGTLFREQSMFARIINGGFRKSPFLRQSLLATVLSSPMLREFGLRWLAESGDELESLNLCSMELDPLASALNALAGVRALKGLALDNSSFDSVRLLAGFSSLQSLSLSDTAIATLDGLELLTRLRDLSIDRTNIDVIDSISQLPGLQTLSLSGTRVKSLSAIVRCRLLREVSIGACAISDLGPVGSLQSLESLFAPRSAVEDLGPLSSLRALMSLVVDDTIVSDLSALSGSSQLRALSIERTRVSDLGPLRRHKGLRSLWLDGSLVASLEPLRGMRQLSLLSLRNTRVTDLSPIRGLKKLEHLDITGVPAPSPGWLRGLDNLRVIGRPD